MRATAEKQTGSYCDEMERTWAESRRQEQLDATLREAREGVGKMYEEMGEDAFFEYVLNDMDKDL